MRITSFLLGRVIFIIGILCSASMYASPSQIIILRHSEKLNNYSLCKTGQLRSLALTDYYLGNGAKKSLFSTTPPAAFFAISLHTIQSIAPVAATWGMPVIAYAVLVPHENKPLLEKSLNEQTQLVAKELFINPYWEGKTVVLSWEHSRIANAEIEKNYPNEDVTLRQLLKLNTLKGVEVPDTWLDSNYDFFWIINYDSNGEPENFEVIRQEFNSRYSNVPSNEWGQAEPQSVTSTCMQ